MFFRRLFKNQALIHLTDVEGNWRYFNNWLKESKYLQWKEGALAFRNPDTKFVYGGDFCDKGPGDLRIGKALNKFKLDNPGKVNLLAGNRETKCLRFIEELNKEKIKERLLVGAPAWWQKEKITPRDYVIKQMLAEKKDSISDHDIQAYIKKISIEKCQTIYLKWMLFETMGCGSSMGKPSTFDYRRQELAELGGQEFSSISDEQVTQSFIDSVSPTGELTTYLQNASLGVIHHDTLFIHGAVTSANIGYVPGISDSTNKRIDDAREWIEAINDWYKKQVQAGLDFSSLPEEKLTAPGCKPIDNYTLWNKHSIVTTNWYQDGLLAPVSDEVGAYLAKAGIERVITGHQPFGDFPLILEKRFNKNILEVIVGDTGYSDPTAKEDTRGNATHQLVVLQKNGESHAEIRAILRDNSSVNLILPSKQQVLSGRDTEIGHFTTDGRLIRPGGSGELITSQLNGFSIIDQPFEHCTLPKL